MYVKDGVTYCEGSEYADALCARGAAEMYAQSDAIAGHELALAQAEAMIESQRDELQRLRGENAGLRLEVDAWRERFKGHEYRRQDDVVASKLHDYGPGCPV